MKNKIFAVVKTLFRINNTKEAPHKTWFTFSAENYNPLNVSEHTPLYRIVPFDSLLQMLNERTIVLVHTDRWEDVYENFLVNEVFMRAGREMPIYKLARRFYGQCWTSRMSSDALWRIYSQDRKSVRIKTTIGKLDDSLPSDDKDGVFLIGKVEYYSQRKIEEDLLVLEQVAMDQLSLLMLQSLFVKRSSFSHESEYKVVFMSNSNPESRFDVISFPIDPLSFIESVCFDPRADDAYVDRCTKVLTGAFGFSKSRIKKSSLYSFKPMMINLV